MKEIVPYHNPVLRKKAEKVKDYREVSTLIMEMKEVLGKEDGVGLAAPQVGESLMVIVVKANNGIYGLINPEIIEKSEEEVIIKEGCLSLKGLLFDVRRAKKVKVTFLNESGQESQIEAEGMMAIVLQHEIDHLNGRLIIDEVGPFKKFGILFLFYFRKLCPLMKP